MKISVITVCYNADKFLERTIRSVLSQTYKPIEYIIIDGGSTDLTLEIIKKYESVIDVIVSEKDNGIYDAMNKGIQLATGDWINFKNAGDCFSSSDAVECFFSQPVDESVGIVHGDCRYENDWGFYLAKPDCWKNEHSMPVIHPSTFVRTFIHKRYLFDTSFKSSGDFDFFTKCRKEIITFEYRPITVCTFRTGGFATQNRLLTYKEDCRILGEGNTLRKWFGYCLLRAEVFLLKFLDSFKWGRKLYMRYQIRKGWERSVR